MSKTTEILTQAMQALGPVVEKVAKRLSQIQLPQSKKTKKPKKTRITDAQGQDFSQTPWDSGQIQKFLSAVEAKFIIAQLNKLKLQQCLHLTTGPSRYLEAMENQGASQAIFELDVAKNSLRKEPLSPLTPLLARGNLKQWPLKEESFNFILCPSALAWRSDLPLLIPEMARCLVSKGRVLLTTIHPFFEYLMNPRNGFPKGLGHLFSCFRRQHFFIEDVQEAPLEEALKLTTLPPNLTEALKRFPGIPVVLLMQAILIKRKQVG